VFWTVGVLQKISTLVRVVLVERRWIFQSRRLRGTDAVVVEIVVLLMQLLICGCGCGCSIEGEIFGQSGRM